MLIRSLSLAVLAIGMLASTVGASTQKDLDSAVKHQKAAFILVTDEGAPGVEEARALAQQAVKQVKKSTLIELKRSDPANADLVDRYQLASAPVPVILLRAGNGALAGGVVAAQTTVEQLVAMVPSPKKAEVLLALEAGKAAFISASRKDMASQAEVNATCAAACGQMSDKCVMIAIDMNDPNEAGFLEQLKVNLAAKLPVTLVVNRQGQITGTYRGAVDVASLVQAANKKAGGCCPSTVQGGSKSCPPPK